MRVLFLTHRLPYAPNRGDRIRAYHALALMARQCEVDLLSFVADREEEGQKAALTGMVRSVTTIRRPRLRNLLRGCFKLATKEPLTHTLLDAPEVRPALARIVADRKPDVVLAYCSGMVRFALAPPLEGIPLVLDMVDVDSEKWKSLAAKSRIPLAWVYAREARVLARFEAEATNRAGATLVVNERERKSLARLAPEARILVVPNGVDLAAFRPPGPPSPNVRVVFTGVMNYSANVEAAVRLVRSVWPRVRTGLPGAELYLVGADPSAPVRALQDPGAGVVVTGSVPDVRHYLWDAAVSVAPLAISRGVQNKVLEALAAGLPCVVTPVVADGLPAETLPGCRVGESDERIAAELLDLLGRSPDKRRAMATGLDLQCLGWSDRLAPLLDVLRTVSGQQADCARDHQGGRRP